MMTEKDFELVRGMIEGFESIRTNAAKRSKKRKQNRALPIDDDCTGEVSE